jgi:hypothetical protein
MRRPRRNRKQPVYPLEMGIRDEAYVGMDDE